MALANFMTPLDKLAMENEPEVPQPMVQNTMQSQPASSDNERKAQIFMKYAQKAAMLGLNSDADNFLAISKSLGGGGQNTNDMQIVEIADPNDINKRVRAGVNKTTGKIHYTFPMGAETFKAKNVMGRGWVTKRPIMQESATGRMIYADSFDKGQIEPASTEDSQMLRPVTLRGLEASQVDQLAGLKNTYDRLDSVINQVDDPKYAKKFGPLAGRWNKIKTKFINEGETQDLQNQLKSFITIAYGLSGKQISDAEMQRLQDALLPYLEQPAENFRATAEFARDWVAGLHNDKLKYFEGAGFDAGLPTLEKKPMRSRGGTEIDKAISKGWRLVEKNGKKGYVSPDGTKVIPVR